MCYVLCALNDHTTERREAHAMKWSDENDLMNFVVFNFVIELMVHGDLIPWCTIDSFNTVRTPTQKSMFNTLASDAERLEESMKPQTFISMSVKQCSRHEHSTVKTQRRPGEETEAE